jgi:uncharacterized protein
MTPIDRLHLPLAALFILLSISVIDVSAVCAADAMTPLDLRQVKVGGEIGRRIDITVNNNLLVIDVERDFLSAFRSRSSTSGYIGMGKLIDSAVKFAAYTNNAKVIALKKHLVEELIKTQQPDGYIGMLAPQNRMAGLWDIHEMGYVVFALTSDYRYFGDKRSLEAAQKLADYILDRWKNLPADWDRQTNVSMHLSVTGLDRTLLALHGQTKEQRYLDFCVQQRALPDWNLGIVMGRRQGVEGHIYAYLVRCLAQLELHRLHPDDRLLQQTQRAMHFMTAEDGACITGETGQWEIWTNDQDGRGALGETCATAYQLRMYDSLLRLRGESHYGDLMERTIYNALFAAQSPDGRNIRYYTALEGPREYFLQDTYCCPNNFRRIVAELPTMVYYRSEAGLAVNLYTPSETTVELGSDVSLKVRQETAFPTSGRVMIRVDPSKTSTFPLKLRIPLWCKGATAAINGRPWEKPARSGEFLSIERDWKPGDCVTLDLPMPWRIVQGRKRQAGRAAVMRGPIVYCLSPAQDERLAKQDAADLGGIMVYPTSLKESTGGDPVRPNGTACAIKAGVAGYDMWNSNNLSLRLTEFPDPEGRCVYFRLPDPNAAVPDELFSGDGE